MPDGKLKEGRTQTRMVQEGGGGGIFEKAERRLILCHSFGHGRFRNFSSKSMSFLTSEFICHYKKKKNSRVYLPH